MELDFKAITWRQFGAAIDMLENALAAAPDEVWSDARQPEFWYVAFHTLFWLDAYLSDSVEGFAPPAPFGLEEMDSDKPPPRPYTQTELQSYLEHGRDKCRKVIQNLTVEKANQRCGVDWLEISNAELLLYNMRHVQHHAAQLNLMLRQTIDSAPAWVRQTKHPLDGLR
jgi:uncharacterized damage-inducible protein DinB